MNNTDNINTILDYKDKVSCIIFDGTFLNKDVYLKSSNIKLDASCLFKNSIEYNYHIYYITEEIDTVNSLFSIDFNLSISDILNIFLFGESDMDEETKRKLFDKIISTMIYSVSEYSRLIYNIDRFVSNETYYCKNYPDYVFNQLSSPFTPKGGGPLLKDSTELLKILNNIPLDTIKNNESYEYNILNDLFTVMSINNSILLKSIMLCDMSDELREKFHLVLDMIYTHINTNSKFVYKYTIQPHILYAFILDNYDFLKVFPFLSSTNIQYSSNTYCFNNTANHYFEWNNLNQYNTYFIEKVMTFSDKNVDSILSTIKNIISVIKQNDYKEQNKTRDLKAYDFKVFYTIVCFIKFIKKDNRPDKFSKYINKLKLSENSKTFLMLNTIEYMKEHSLFYDYDNISYLYDNCNLLDVNIPKEYILKSSSYTNTAVYGTISNDIFIVNDIFYKYVVNKYKNLLDEYEIFKQLILQIGAISSNIKISNTKTSDVLLKRYRTNNLEKTICDRTYELLMYKYTNKDSCIKLEYILNFIKENISYDTMRDKIDNIYKHVKNVDLNFHNKQIKNFNNLNILILFISFIYNNIDIEDNSYYDLCNNSDIGDKSYYDSIIKDCYHYFPEDTINVINSLDNEEVSKHFNSIVLYEMIN